jgi:YD repeat-containing protein
MNQSTSMMKPVISLLLCTLVFTSVAAHADTKVRTRSYEYTSQGLLSKEVIEPNSPNDCLQTSYAYDSFGNRISSIAATCTGATGNTISSAATARTNTLDFGSNGRFPVTATNALSQSETRSFDARFGSLTALTGPNQLQSTWIYDTWGRKSRETRADLTYTTWAYKLCTEAGANCPGSVGPAVVSYVTVEQSYDKNGTVSAPEKRAYFDNLNRLVRTQTLGFDAPGTTAPVLYQDTEYNAQGQIARQSRIYANTDAPVWTSYEYDALGRVTSESHPDAGGIAQTTYAYNGLTTTRTRTVANISTDIQGGQWAAPTITASQSPSPWVATLPGTLSWTSTNASVVTYKCTSTGSGYTANQTVGPSGTSASQIASEAWAGNPSTCVFTAAGPGGTATYSLTVNTLPPPRIPVTINVTAQNNYVANPSKVAGYAAGRTDVIFNITSNVGSSSAAQAAFTVDSSWAAGDTVKVVINTGVGVYGGGGAGGGGGLTVPWQTNYYPGGGGGTGGNALNIQRATTVVNNGTIAGGGGGGGGGSGGLYVDSEGIAPRYGGGGGGGQGLAGGTGGVRTNMWWDYGSGNGGTGSIVAAGAGGAGSSQGGGGTYSGTPNTSASNGGAGGGFGMPGAAGANGAWNAKGGAGGAAGAAVVGNAFVTWTTAGTRLGALQ